MRGGHAGSSKRQNEKNHEGIVSTDVSSEGGGRAAELDPKGSGRERVNGHEERYRGEFLLVCFPFLFLV